MHTNFLLNILIGILVISLSILFLHDLNSNAKDEASFKHKQDNPSQKEIKSKSRRSYITKYYTWKYNGKHYNLQLRFDKSTYSYYKENIIAPRKIKGEITYSRLLRHNHADGLFSRLADKLRSKALNNNLSQAQLAELAVSFVQSIPYDHYLANKIENQKAFPKHPYEVLYEKSGICSGKSFLIHILLNKLQFGTCLFIFDKADHMMAGIKCPKTYSNFNSGYCYIESTSYFPIGLASSDFNKLKIEDLVTKYSIDLVSSWEIKSETNGRTYNKIKRNLNLLNALKEINIKSDILKSNLDRKSKKFKEIKNKMDQLKERLEHYKRNNQRDKYQTYAKKYNRLLAKARSIKENYNQIANNHNMKVSEYKALVTHLLIQQGSQ